MEAGPQLDRLVAERVMGWEYVIDGEGTGWIDTATEQFIAKYSHEDPSQPEIEPPPFSTHIASAWEVVEKLKTNGMLINLDDDGEGWEVEIFEVNTVGRSGHCVEWDSYASKAPLAICRAALKAITLSK